jgi:hypothetical protein
MQQEVRADHLPAQSPSDFLSEMLKETSPNKKQFFADLNWILSVCRTKGANIPEIVLEDEWESPEEQKFQLAVNDIINEAGYDDSDYHFDQEKKFLSLNR